jgi:hypothetical protein
MQVHEPANAASHSLERFFVSQQLTSKQVECILNSLEFVRENLTLEKVANPYTPPEMVVEELLKLPHRKARRKRAITALKALLS